MLAAKKPPSTMMNSAATAPAPARLQPQISRMAMNSSTLVISMVSDTATP